jgi:hypothetical protein
MLAGGKLVHQEYQAQQHLGGPVVSVSVGLPAVCRVG